MSTPAGSAISNLAASPFVWGTATASFQIEGAWNADGKGPSIWDNFCRKPGATHLGATGEVACDHYHRYAEDIALMADLGLQAYRFSLSWPRLLPQGTGSGNPAGLDFYDRLVDSLLAKGIAPWVTLYHWDLPQALAARGGWQNPDSPKWFSEYTRLAVERLGDRVAHWLTFNEPQIFTGLAHRMTLHAPGHNLPDSELVPLVHHVLLAHGLSTQAIRACARLAPRISWATIMLPTTPVDEKDSELVTASRHATFRVDPAGHWPLSHSWWTDPIYLGRYPEDGLAGLGQHLPAGWERDLATIAQPMDFLAMNTYHSRARAERAPDGQVRFRQENEFGPQTPRTHFHWPVTPESLYWGPRFLHERYRLPIVVTENGLSTHDWVALDGAVHDPLRIDFLHRYLRDLMRARAEGVPVQGYFHWSLLDNLEWAAGYEHRFGLIHVDFSTQKRTPKDSAHWYREVIRTNGARLQD